MTETMNTLVVAIYSRSEMLRDEMGSSDLGIAASQIRNNIRQGLPIDPVRDIPLKYVPDYKAWHQAEETIGTDEFTKQWAAMNDLRRKLWEPLYQLYSLKKFDEMVEIMDNPPTDKALDNWTKGWNGVRPAPCELPDEPIEEGDATNAAE